MNNKNWNDNWQAVKYALYLAHHEGMGNIRMSNTIQD
jgi:hypothetical protein